MRKICIVAVILATQMHAFAVIVQSPEEILASLPPPKSNQAGVVQYRLTQMEELDKLNKAGAAYSSAFSTNIKIGDTPDNVRAAIGEPKGTAKSGEQTIWFYGTRGEVIFKNNKVFNHTIISAESAAQIKIQEENDRPLREKQNMEAQAQQQLNQLQRDESAMWYFQPDPLDKSADPAWQGARDRWFEDFKYGLRTRQFSGLESYLKWIVSIPCAYREIHEFTAEQAVKYMPENIKAQYDEFNTRKQARLENERQRIYQEEYAKQQQQNIQSNSVAEISCGTGWFCKGGYIVTCYHVVSNHKRIFFGSEKMPKTEAFIAAFDKANDLALLRCKDGFVAPPAITLSQGPATQGENVFTLGFPHLDLLGKAPKFSEGTISATTGMQDDPRTMQISVPLQSGNSGGPLVNLKGEVVGVVASKFAAIAVFAYTGDLPENVSFAVKTGYLKPLLESLPVKETSRSLPNTPADKAALIKRVQDSLVLIMAE